MIASDSIVLNNGQKMPQLGLGTWRSKSGEAIAALKEAIKIGYRHIDTAAVYENEKEVGEGIKAGMEAAGISREDMFIVSKLWNNKHHPDDVQAACKKTLSDLGLAYLDLYLVHWPMAFKRGEELFPKNEDGSPAFDTSISPLDTWKAMEKLVKEGLVKSIGVSNFNSEQIQEIIDKGEIKPVTNQVECHPYLNQAKLLEFCKGKNISLTGYSPLGSPERPWASPDEPVLLEDPKIHEIAKSKGKTAAQVLLRWQIQRGVIIIPKSANPTRIAENANIFDFSLTEEEMKIIDSFDKGSKGRFIVPRKPNGEYRDSSHPDFPFNIEF